MKLPREIGPIHFVGIGGIGMSGIAEVLHQPRLHGAGLGRGRQRQRQAAARQGHQGLDRPRGRESRTAPRCVVVSTAIKRDNPELDRRARQAPAGRAPRRDAGRADAAEAAASPSPARTARPRRRRWSPRCSTPAGFDPTVINGGIINAYGTNARLGAGDWMVVEADESDGTFLKLPADVAIVTNIDPEHLDHFRTFDAVQDAFRAFVENVPFYGFAVMCTDHPTVQALVGRIEDRRIITYGENPQADVRLDRSSTIAGGQSRFSRACSATATARPCTASTISRCRCRAATTRSTPRRRSRSRTSSASPTRRSARRSQASAASSGASPAPANGTASPSSTTTATIRSRSRRCCRAARESTKGQVIAVVQPHRYTRLQSLFEQFSTCFNDADAVIVADVYAAGEAPIEGVDRDTSCTACARAATAGACRSTAPADSSPASCKRLAEPGDYVVCLGAGNITQWAYALPRRVEGAGRDELPGHRLRTESARRRSCAAACCRTSRSPIHLVPRRRAGAGAVHAGGRGRSRVFPGATCRRTFR